MTRITIQPGYAELPDFDDKYELAAHMRREPSPGEAVLWNAIHNKIKIHRTLVRVNRQQVIRGYIADFYMPAFRAIVEVDGDQHLSDSAADYDDRRDDLFLEWGYSIFRVRSKLVIHDPELVAELIDSFLEVVDEERPYRTLFWQFSSYGILWHSYSGLHFKGHWFRITPDLPASVPCLYGAEVGDTDYHELTDCAAARCREWAPVR